MTDSIKPVLRAEMSPEAGKIRISIIDGAKELASTEIDAWAASAVAAMVLDVAKRIGETPERLNAPMVDGSFSTVPATATSVLESHMPECKTLVFRFGQTVLGVSIHQDAIPDIVQRLTDGEANHPSLH